MSCPTGVSLTWLGRSAERWHVRVERGATFTPVGLTVALVSEDGRALGPAVVVPLDGGRCHVAELRGPEILPPGTRVVATADTESGYSEEYTLHVDARRGLHAFLHADGRLPLENDPTGGSLTKVQLRRLARRFPWVSACCANPPTATQEVPDDLASMLQTEFDVDPADLDDDLLEALRR